METLHTCLPQRQVLLLKSSISKPTGHTTQDWCDDLQNYRQQPLSRKSFLLTLGSKNFNLFFCVPMHFGALNSGETWREMIAEYFMKLPLSEIGFIQQN